MGLALRWRVAPLALLFATMALMAPASVRASTVFADVHLDEDDYFGPVSFTAAPGERNRVRVRVGDLGIVFHDARSRIRVRGQCRSRGRHTATCPTSDNMPPSISLRDGNDSLKLATGVMAAATGGAGDDVLTGGYEAEFYGNAGNDLLRGGPWIDTLSGGPGRDRLYGRGGDDHLIDGETDAQAARDVFDGGPGSDSVDFSGRYRSLRINLATGRASTHDTIVGIEQVIAGSGNDRLTAAAARASSLEGGPGDDDLRGGAAGDGLLGGPGNDRVAGGAGNDVVWGDAGSDQLSGDAGDDLIESNEVSEGGTASPATADAVACGDGADNVVSDASDTLEPACEGVWAGGDRFATVPVLRNDRAEFRADALPGAMEATGTLALQGPTGEQYGQADYDVPSNGTTTVSVPLTPNGVAALHAGTVIQVHIVPTLNDPSVAAGGYRMPLPAS